MCKRRKIRCDGKVAGGKCSNCNDFEWNCTYENATKKFPTGYVQALQAKVAKLEALLRELHPDTDFTPQVGITLTRTNWMRKGVLGDDNRDSQGPLKAGSDKLATLASPVTSHSHHTVSHSPAGAPIQEHPLHSGGSTKPTSDPKDEEQDVVIKLNKLSLLSSKLKQTHVGNYHGRSSNRALMMNTFALFKELDPTPSVDDAPRELDLMRSEFWEHQPWEIRSTMATMREYRYPEPSLLEQLVSLYFSRINFGVPILHEPLFRMNLRNQLHRRSWEFGAVVLLVCANGARYSDDPRVFVVGSNSEHSAGYEWFSQVTFAPTIALSSDASLLQAMALGVIYLSGKSEVAAWNLCGTGIRLAQNLGVHRKPAYGAGPSINDELFKRPFWTLIVFDRWLSASLGRACAIVDDDLDLDYPTDCDDEYWAPTDGSPAFRQPEGQPSRVSAFICVLQLSQILASALRTLHASDKTKARHGFTGPDWEQRAIAFYDSSLNQWLASLPTHLRWDPQEEDPAHLTRCASLMARYYDTQIIIHRPSISSQQSTALPSLTICANAARSCLHIIGTLRRRTPGRAPHLYSCAFTCGAVLLYNIGNSRRLKVPENPEDLRCVHICMDYLKSLEHRWQSTGRSWDSLNIILSLGRLSSSNDQQSRGQKRARDAAADSDTRRSTGIKRYAGETAGSRTDTSGAHLPNTMQGVLLSNWAEASPFPSVFAAHEAQEGSSPWSAQWDQTRTDFSGTFDTSSASGVGTVQDAHLGGAGIDPWPFALDGAFMAANMNSAPSQTLASDPFSGVASSTGDQVFAALGAGMWTAGQDGAEFDPLASWQHPLQGFDGTSDMYRDQTQNRYS
ncbi:unnamed protein product [Peniophora sp. CBMAI 1063]|nr:unnamed protein product [Peniophora sp. CBMAI 1063]